MGISIHSLIRGRTKSSLILVLFQYYFNPLPHTRENTAHSLGNDLNKRFQSTPSYEGELSSFFAFSRYGNFNPLPHTRENSTPIAGASTLSNFNPLPHTRENSSKAKNTEKSTISIHSLIRGRTCAIYVNCSDSFGFQSTPSYEGEPLLILRCFMMMKFQSTPSYEGERYSEAYKINKK